MNKDAQSETRAFWNLKKRNEYTFAPEAKRQKLRNG